MQNLSIIFEGASSNYAFSVANPDQLANIAQTGGLHDVVNLPECVYGDQLLFLRAQTNTTFTYAEVINDAYTSSSNEASYIQGTLSDQLAIIARMIKGGLGTKVYMVSLDGFDTHADQVNKQRTLHEDLANSIKHFYEDLASAGYDDKVLGMTISEFGRRPYENGSNGTDHGAASPTFLFGAGLNGNGFVGAHPDIDASAWDNNNNLVPSTDFRDVYASVLTDWFCLDPSIVNTILLNDTYQTLNLGFNCQGLNTSDFANVSRFSHVATYRDNRTFIEINAIMHSRKATTISITLKAVRPIARPKKIRLFSRRLLLGIVCKSRCIKGIKPRCLIRSFTPSSSMVLTPRSKTSPTLNASRASLVLNLAPRRHSPSSAKSSEASLFKNSCFVKIY